MLISIRKRPEVGDDDRTKDRPADLLLACHGRIRTFSRIAEALASAASVAPPAEIAEAAAAVHRYHHLALPLHEADEDESIRPRLEAAGARAEVLEALAAVEEDHRRIDALVAELSPIWIDLARDPADIARARPRLAGPTAALGAMWDRHLSVEEELIFPEVGHLPPETQRVIAAEMRARRGAVG